VRVGISERRICPRCGRLLHYKYDGLFRWKVCPAFKSCGWTVFTHGDDPQDGKEMA